MQIAIEGLSKILCMEQRKNVAKKKRPRRDHVTHHVTHVIDDGGANDGTRKSHVHEKTIKSPVLPYNKWESQPTKGTARSDSPIPVSEVVGGVVSDYIVADGTLHQTEIVCSNNGIFEAEVEANFVCLFSSKRFTWNVSNHKKIRNQENVVVRMQ